MSYEPMERVVYRLSVQYTSCGRPAACLNSMFLFLFFPAASPFLSCSPASLSLSTPGEDDTAAVLPALRGRVLQRVYTRRRLFASAHTPALDTYYTLTMRFGLWGRASLCSGDNRRAYCLLTNRTYERQRTAGISQVLSVQGRTISMS
jgi:hypothetical protein